ncbi:MAG: LemA family protein [Candidatus Gracilibacteria bacterium]|nr:LemA family protein [Candidatus Gracilibacteria bacterium]
MELFLAILLFAAVIGGITMIYFNKIVKLKVRVGEAWSDINVQLKRRHNLIGNLVETVKGYASHESETFEKVIQARNAAKEAENGGLAAVQSAERNLSAAMGGLNINALSEAYPDLKANESFNNLMAELTDTEDKIAASRRFYNSTVLGLNTMIQQFPGMLFAGFAGAKVTEFFELDEDEIAEVKEAPKVDFNMAKKTAPAVGTASPEPVATPASSPTATPAPTSTAPVAPAPATTPEAPNTPEAPTTETPTETTSTPGAPKTDGTPQ